MLELVGFHIVLAFASAAAAIIFGERMVSEIQCYGVTRGTIAMVPVTVGLFAMVPASLLFALAAIITI